MTLPATSLAALREQLSAVIAPPPPGSTGLATGIAALDAALPGGGIPRGRLTELVGAPGSGKTTLARRLVAATTRQGLWVAYIDAARTLDPRDWARLGEREGVWMIRPRDPARGAWCADVLLRSGAFALVILDGVPPLTRGVAVRLVRLARESEAALVVMSDEGTRAVLGGAVRLRVAGAGAREARRRRRVPGAGGPGEMEAQHTRRRIAVTVEKGGGSGTHRTVEVSGAIGVARRLCAHPEVPDRRGVDERPSGRERAARPAGAAAAPVAGAVSSGSGAGGGAGGWAVGEGGRGGARRDDARRADVPRALRAAVARARALG